MFFLREEDEEEEEEEEEASYDRSRRAAMGGKKEFFLRASILFRARRLREKLERKMRRRSCKLRTLMKAKKIIAAAQKRKPGTIKICSKIARTVRR